LPAELLTLTFFAVNQLIIWLYHLIENPFSGKTLKYLKVVKKANLIDPATEIQKKRGLLK